MSRDKGFEIGLCLNAIGTLLDDDSREKVKPYLDKIEKLVLEEVDDGNNE